MKTLFENNKKRIFKTFHKNTNKLTNLLIYDKEKELKYIAEFDKKEQIKNLLIFNQKNNTHTHFKMNNSGDILQIKGDKPQVALTNIKYNKKTLISN